MPRSSPTGPSEPRGVALRSIDLDALLSRFALPIVAGIVAIAFLFALRLRFVQDDAFISFVYARGLVEGHGLTWFGARVEGYTNFFWVLWSALGLRLGIEPVLWSWTGGLAAFVAALLGTWKLARAALGNRFFPSFMALLLLVTNYSFLCFATGGLETMPQTALLTWAVLQVLRLRALAARPAQPDDAPLRTCLWLSWLLAGAILMRIDSALPAAILLVLALRVLRAERGGRRTWAALLLPLAVIVGAWMAWKLVYYGSFLPNTFYAKVGWTSALLRNGLLYLWRFLHGYMLWPFLVLGAVAIVVQQLRSRPLVLDERRRSHPAVRPRPVRTQPAEMLPPAGGAPADVLPLAVLVVTWCAYLVAIGGDFMEFRLLVPLAPCLYVLLAYLVHDGIGRLLGDPRAIAGLTVLVLVFFSARHATRFTGVTSDRSLDSVHALGNFYEVYEDRDWSWLGNALGQELQGQRVLLAAHAVGAIPYYSQIPTLDMYGLSDAWVARHGNPATPHYRRPGHQRQAPLSYMRQRGVNFVIAHPTLLRRGRLADPRAFDLDRKWVRDHLSFEPQLPDRVTLVAMPLNDEAALLMWYLTPTPELDALIRDRHWETVTLDMGVPQVFD